MRVLLTRAKPDAERTAAALAAIGHIAVSAPVTEIRRTGAALPAGRFDAVAATSHHAFGGREAGLDRGLAVFAVGRRTAEAARGAGFSDVRVSAGDASALADLVRLTLPRPARILYLAGRDRKPTLEATLAAAGYGVTPAEVYAAETLDRWPPAAHDALRDGRVDAALHYSRRGVGLTLALAGREGLGEAVLRLSHACLSTDAAAPLLARGAPSVAVAERPDEEALLALLSTAPSPLTRR